MPETYTVKLSDGREFDVTTEGGPPSEAAILASLAQSGSGQPRADASQMSPHGSNTALGMATAARAVPAAAGAAMELATNPSVTATARTAGQIAGGVIPIAKYGPVGVLGLDKGAKIGGKVGELAGKAAQKLAAPLGAEGVGPASFLGKIAPYAQTLATLSGAQGALDLAQIAEPTRRDIGTLGVTIGDERDPDHPALLNLLAMKASDAIGTLIRSGLSLGEASRTYWNAKARAGK